MDVLRFVNSADLREHLKKIGSRFSGFEAAWLVWNCREASLPEKRAAWKEILSEYPDEVYPNLQPGDLRTAPVLHASLRRFLSLEKEAERFVRKEEKSGFVWRYEFCESKNGEWFSSGGVFASFRTALASGLDLIADLKEQRAMLRVEKIPADGTECGVFLVMNAEGCVLRADPEGYARIKKEEAIETASFFEEMWFSFPTPFRKGDLLRDPGRPGEGAYVLEETAAELAARLGRPLRDTTDMVAYGVFASENGELYRDCASDYTSAERIPSGSLSGKERALIPYSRFLKGEIDALGLASAVRLFEKNMAGE